MQRYHLRALMLFTVLLALAGCSTEQPKPAAVAPLAKTATDTVNNPVLQARLANEEDGRPEVGIGTLTPGSSVVTWLSNNEFYIQFDSDNLNPCSPDGASPTRSFAYNSIPDASTKTNKVTCALKDKKAGQAKPQVFRYQIFAGSYPPKALKNPPKGHGKRPRRRPLDTGHCEGCVIVE